MRAVEVEVLNWINRLGLRPPFELPEGMLAGPFVWCGTIAAAAATVTDLTAAAAQMDGALLRKFMAGAAAANAPYAVYLDAVQLLLGLGNADAADGNVAHNCFQFLQMHHLGVGPDTYVSMGPYLGPLSEIQADTTAAASVFHRLSNQGPRKLPFPLVINVESDTWELNAHTSLAAAATVDFVLIGYGLAFDNSYLAAGKMPEILSDPDVQRALERSADIKYRRKTG